MSDQNLDSAELEFRRFWTNLNKFDINWSKLYLPNPLNFTKSQKKIGRIFKPARAGGDAAQRNFHAKKAAFGKRCHQPQGQVKWKAESEVGSGADPRGPAPAARGCCACRGKRGACVGSTPSLSPRGPPLGGAGRARRQEAAADSSLSVDGRVPNRRVVTQRI
jgi:hypothetical protein